MCYKLRRDVSNTLIVRPMITKYTNGAGLISYLVLGTIPVIFSISWLETVGEPSPFQLHIHVSHKYELYSITLQYYEKTI